jgi:hypothetical protein
MAKLLTAAQSSNGKTANAYCLQMSKPFKPTLFKSQTFYSYCLLMAKRSKPTFLKGKTIDIYSLPMAKLSTPIVFKWQSRRKLFS